MEPQVVKVFSMKKLFKEIGDFGILFLFCVFGALINERSPHLKGKWTFFSFCSLSIYKGIFIEFNVLSLVSSYFTIILSVYIVLFQFSRVKEHYISCKYKAYSYSIEFHSIYGREWKGDTKESWHFVECCRCVEKIGEYM